MVILGRAAQWKGIAKELAQIASELARGVSVHEFRRINGHNSQVNHLQVCTVTLNPGIPLQPGQPIQGNQPIQGEMPMTNRQGQQGPAEQGNTQKVLPAPAQGDGQTERANQDIEKQLRLYYNHMQRWLGRFIASCGIRGQ